MLILLLNNSDIHLSLISYFLKLWVTLTKALKHKSHFDCIFGLMTIYLGIGGKKGKRFLEPAVSTGTNHYVLVQHHLETSWKMWSMNKFNSRGSPPPIARLSFRKHVLSKKVMEQDQSLAKHLLVYCIQSKDELSCWFYRKLNLKESYSAETYSDFWKSQVKENFFSGKEKSDFWKRYMWNQTKFILYVIIIFSTLFLNSLFL
jgi:hypothetical protein